MDPDKEFIKSMIKKRFPKAKIKPAGRAKCKFCGNPVRRSLESACCLKRLQMPPKVFYVGR